MRYKAACVYLLGPLEADSTLRWSHAAARAAGEADRVQARLHFRVFLLKRQTPGPGVAPVVFFLVVAAGAVNEGRPSAAAHPEPPHAVGSSARLCVTVGVSRTGSHKNQHLQFVKKHADPVLEHVWLHVYVEWLKWIFLLFKKGVLFFVNMIIIIILANCYCCYFYITLLFVYIIIVVLISIINVILYPVWPIINISFGRNAVATLKSQRKVSKPKAIGQKISGLVIFRLMACMCLLGPMLFLWYNHHRTRGWQ